MSGRNIRVGDIWKWVSATDDTEEYWLIVETPSRLGVWIGLCLQGYDAGRSMEITVDNQYADWEKIA